MAERLASGPPTLEGSSEANAVPLGRKGSAKGKEDKKDEGEEMEVDEHAEEEVGMQVEVTSDKKAERDAREAQIFMASLRNKNKKKGFFKEAMMKGLSDGSKAKIVFAEVDKEEEAEVAEKKPPAVLPRLVPPSELQAQGRLPKNVFVTSVDVEEGMWEGGGKKKKIKRKEKI